MNKQKFILLVLFSVLLVQVKAQSIITLEQALDMASKGSPSLQSSLYNLDRTTESLNAQRAALKSQFSLNVNPMEYSNSRRFFIQNSEWLTNKSLTTSGTARIDQPILYTDGKISLVNSFGWQSNKSESDRGYNEDQSYFNNLSLSLTQPLFTYNRTKLQIKNLELDNENAMLSYAIQRLTLEKNVSQFFYNVYMAQMSLSIAQEELANTEKSNEIIKNKVDAGLAAREELYQSEVNLATAKSRAESGRVSLENAKDQFKEYVGMDIFEEISVMTDVVVNPIEVDGKKALEHGLASRMELRQRQISVETSQFDLIQVKSQNEFRGDMTLSIGLSSDNPNIENVFDKATKSPRVSLGFNIPLFDWGERAARIRAQEAVIKSQKLGYSNMET